MNWLHHVQSKMKAESAINTTDQEIERCFDGCVMKNKLIEKAKAFRDSGLLSVNVMAERQEVNYVSV